MVSIGSFLSVWVEVKNLFHFPFFVRYQSTTPALWAWLVTRAPQTPHNFLPEWVPQLSASSLNNLGIGRRFAPCGSHVDYDVGTVYHGATISNCSSLFRTENEGWYCLRSPSITAIVWSYHEFSSTTPFMAFSVTYTTYKGPKLDAERFQTVTFTMFVNISNFLKWKSN